MSADRWMLSLSAVWLALVLAGIGHAALATPTGDGFVRGMNVVAIFLVWQAAAVLLGVVCLVVAITRRREVARPVLAVGLVPPTVSLAAVALLAIWIATA